MYASIIPYFPSRKVRVNLIIGTEEFPHPKAKSDQQQRQEQNIMYVAITRAIHDLYFVDAPFTRVHVPGYDPDAERLTITNAPQAEFLSLSPYENEREPLHHDEIQEGMSLVAEKQPVKNIFAGVQNSDLSDEWLEKENEEVTREIDGLYSEMHPRLTLVPSETRNIPEPTLIREPKKQDAFVGKLLAIEVLCPTCGNSCADPKTGSLMITEDLIGHSVTCVECHTRSLVPLNAFTLAGNIVAREKPTSSSQYNKAEKKGRTQKERKSNAGRKAKSGTVRQPRQLSLDVRTIKTLDAMKTNNSELFETLLQQYEPFLDTWAEMGYGSSQEDEDE